MRKNISLFLFVLLSFVIRLSAQAQPVAHLSVDQSSILENSGSTKLVVTLRNTSGALANATSVTNATITFTGVAINGTDYTISNLTSSTSNIISIPVGTSSGFLTITATDDNIIEPDENILAEISSINVGTIDNINKDREIEILDDDLVVTLKLQAGDTFLLEEGSPKTRMRLQINQPASVDIEVQVGMTGGDAINADVNFTGVVKIDDGSTFNEFEIYAIDDNAYEDTETFYIKTTNIKSGPGKLAKDSIAFSIIDNDPPKVSFTLDKDSVVEDGGVAKITITLSRPFGKDSKIALNYEGLDPSVNTSLVAEKDSDFSSSQTEIVTIPAGDTTAVVTITAIDDNIQDPNERIVITLNNTFSDTPPSENITYEIGNKAIIKIIDDENPPVAVNDNYTGTLSVDEGGELIISDSLLGLLVNDYDPEGTKLTIKQFGVPLAGIVSCPVTGLPGICPDGTFSYKHQGDETPSGKDNFSYKITDEDGFSATGQVTIIVNPVNDCPFVDGEAIKVNEGETFTRDLTLGVLDPEFTLGLDLTLDFELISPPSVGTISISPSGEAIYTAPPFITGSDPLNVFFEYKVTDGGGCVKNDVIAIQINNSVPQAVADTFIVGVGGTINILAPGILANDPIPVGATGESGLATSPTIAISSGPNAFNLNTDGSFTYTHNGSSSPKMDKFTYSMLIIYSPGVFDISNGEVFIKVNDCPTTVTDTYVVDEGGILIVDSLNGLLNNDSDINGDKLFAYKDSDPKVLEDHKESKKSLVTVNEDGSFTYTHGGGEGELDYFLYYANDGVCDSPPDTVKIIVNPVNDCPVTRANGYNSLSLLNGAPIKDYIENLVDLNGNPMSIDSVDVSAVGDTLTVYSSDGTTWILDMDEGGSITRDSAGGALKLDIDPDGDFIFMRELLPGSSNWILDKDGNPVYPFPGNAKSYTVNPDGSFTYEHDGGGNVRDKIYVEVCDVPQTGLSCCSVDSILLFFGPDNACAEGLTDYFTVNEGGALVADEDNMGYNQYMYDKSGGTRKYTGVLFNDVDEEGDTLNVALGEKPIFGTIVGDTIYPDGSFTYIHNGGEQTADMFTYFMGDIQRECSEVKVYINVVSVNECPTANDTIYTVDEGGTLTITGLAGGSDGTFRNFPAIMGNDFDFDIGSKPHITDNLIAFYSMSEYFDSIPGPDLDLDGEMISTILVQKKADDQSINNFDGFMLGGVPDTLSLPNPTNCEAATGGKCGSPAYFINYPKSPRVVPDRFQPPHDRNAFEFDGDSSYVHVTDQILSLNRSRYTISGWFRSFNDPADNPTILNFTVNGQEKGLKIGIKNNKLEIGIGNGTGYSVKALSNVGTTDLISTWNHFVFMKNGNNYKMYLNKNEIYSEDLNNISLSGVAAQLLMGRDLSGNFFNGRMDELYVIGDTISQDDVLKLYYGVSTSLVNEPDDGDLTDFNVDGSFTYVHSGKDGDFEDNFIYELSDGACGELGKVTIIINPVNDCPIGIDDTLNVDEGGTVTFDAPGILTNDTDEEGDTLKAFSYIDPLYGIATISEDGKIEYIHDNSETTLDSLKYIVSDSVCQDTATVYITINPIPDCPIVEDDIYYVTEGDTLTVDSCFTQVLNPGSNNENWALNEPNSAGDENIGEIYSDGTWNDEKETTLNQPYLMEVNSLITSKSGYNYIGQYDGHSYFTSNSSFLWYDAKADAESKGGYLAMIKSKEENDTVAAMISSGNYHFGLYQDVSDKYFAEPKGGWKWIDGTYLYDTGDSRTLCGVLLNDDDGGGDTLFVNNWTLPDNGILDNNEIKYDGKFTYYHDGSQLGDTIEYKIESELCESDTWGRIIIIPINVNDCPVARRDTFYIDEGTTLDTLGILLNDTDVDGDNLRAEKDTISSGYENHGITQIFPNGRLLYQHDGSETSLDSISYKAIDPSGCEVPSKVIIIINRVNDIPVGVDDSYSVFEGDTLTVDEINGILSNDSDADSVSDLRVLIIKNVSVGTLDINEDGSFTYIHDGSDKPNEVCFTYRAYDGVVGPPPGYSEETEVCITILNRVPFCEGEDFNILENETLTTDLTNGVLSNCTDPDPQDILTVILDTPPTNGTFVLNDDGTFTYDHDCSDDPDEIFFTYFVTDGEDTTKVSDTTRIFIENECPVGNDDLYSGVDEGGILNIGPFDGVLSNDTDQNSCDILQIKPLDPPSFGGVVLNSDGSFDYTHDDSENFEDQFTYLLNDGECSTWDTVTVTIRIDPVPDTPPVAVADDYPCFDEGGFVQALLPEDGVLSNDYDDDPGQTLTAVLVVYPLHGTLILNPNGTFIYTHDSGESTSDSFTYYAVDDTGLTSDTVSVTFCINPVNDCPVPVDDIFTIDEGDIIDSTLIFNDFDVEGNDLLINITAPPSIGGFSWNQDGSFTYNAPDDVPAPGPEIVTFEYLLSDNADGFATCDSTATVTIIVNYVNDCPIVGDDSIIVDGSIPSSRVISVLDNDYDPDSQIDTTSVKIISGPVFGDAISNIDGTITYNYDESPIPFDTITYSVSDFEGCEKIGKVYIYIENLRTPQYQLPNYFTPNGDDFNDFFLIKHQNILVEDMNFEVKIYDRYQRLVHESFIQSSDKVWNGMNIDSSDIVRTDFYYYEITPVEYYNTPYVRRRDKLIGTVYLEKER
ncbi:MAG: Ig-like domain-containing protein [Cytophagales bacterium]